MHVVVETSFEYNDEIHSVGESEGGTPRGVFENVADAKESMKTLTVEFLRNWKDLCGFGYGMDEIYSRRPKFIVFSGVGGSTAEQDEEFMSKDPYEVDQLIDTPNRSQEDLEELASCLEFTPYFITEVPLG